MSAESRQREGSRPVPTGTGSVLVSDSRPASGRSLTTGHENRFRETLEHAPVGIALVGLDGGWFWANQTLCDIVGYSHDELLGRTFQDITHPDDLGPDLLNVHRLLAGEMGWYSMEKRYIHKAGPAVWINLTVSLVRGEGSRPDHFIAIVQDIGGRKRAEDALHVSESRMRSIVDTLVDGVITIDESGVVQSANAAAERVFGYTESELRGRNISELMPEPYRSEHDGYLERYLRTGLARVIGIGRQVQGLRRDGSTFPMELSVGDFSLCGRRYFTGVVRDITDQVRTERALRESEERQRRALSAARIGHWDWDIEADVVTYHGGLKGLYGRPEESAFEDHLKFLEAVHPDDRARVMAAAERRFLEGIPYDVEFRVVWPDGSVRWLAGKGGIFRDGSGRAVRMTGVNIDVTERKWDEEELRRREREFETLAENSPNLISRFDIRSRYLYVNPTIERVTGLPRDRFHGRTHRELGLPPDFCSLWDAKLRSVIQDRRETSFEFSFAGPCVGFHYLARLVPEFGLDGGVASVLGVCTDITERKALQAELLSIAEREQRRIGQDLHDDVGQELTGVGLMAEALVEALEEGGRPEAALAAKIRARLGHARERIRTLSRGLVPVEVDGRGLMDAMEDLCDRVGALQQGIEATFVCETPVHVEDNRVATQLYRITQEAIANAIKHGQARRIRVGLGERDGQIILEVRDDGIGILDESRRGPGMGLKIMQYRAGLLGGTLDLGPAEGRQGTRVVCIIKGGRGDVGGSDGVGSKGRTGPGRRRPPDRA